MDDIMDIKNWQTTHLNRRAQLWYAAYFGEGFVIRMTFSRTNGFELAVIDKEAVKVIGSYPKVAEACQGAFNYIRERELS